MPLIAVYVAGGVVQDVLADCDGVRVVIVNYDDEKCAGTRSRLVSAVASNAEYIQQTVSRTECAGDVR